FFGAAMEAGRQQLRRRALPGPGHGGLSLVGSDLLMARGAYYSSSIMGVARIRSTTQRREGYEYGDWKLPPMDPAQKSLHI
ncbi:MAG: hypothetical protein ABSE86_03140, partial [Bryobacteraceae bacterium]